jgi:hypothetical protein
MTRGRLAFSADRRHLMRGERIVWEGIPSTGLLLRPIELFLIPFSLIWGGFAISWNWMAWNAPGDDLFFGLFGLPFLAIGIYLIAGRFVIDAWLRGRMRYLVTDQRIIILKRGGASLQSLDIRHLPAVELKERSDGSGSIRFAQDRFRLMGSRFGIWSPAMDPMPQFLAIDNVRSVYSLIRQQAG